MADLAQELKKRGQNFWDGAFREGKIAFIGRQVGASHVLLSEAYTMDWWLSKNNIFVLQKSESVPVDHR